jgi:hypothetical protein
MRLMLSGRASGIMFMALFGAVWAWQAAGNLSMPYAALVYGVAALMAGGLLIVSFSFRKLARSQPEPSAEELAAAARADKWFYWVLGGEGVALFLAGAILPNLHLAAYLWSAVALIVGLHFYPLRYVFRLPVYDVTGTLMSLAALMVIVALATGYDLGLPHGWDVVLGFCCALILWGTCGFIILGVRQKMAEASVATRSMG